MEDEYEEVPRWEIELDRRALVKGWLVNDPDKRAKVLEQLYSVALDPRASERSRLIASKAILAAEKVAQSWDDNDLKAKALENGNGSVNVLAVITDLQNKLGNPSPGVAGQLPGA